MHLNFPYTIRCRVQWHFYNYELEVYFTELKQYYWNIGIKENN